MKPKIKTFVMAGALLLVVLSIIGTRIVLTGNMVKEQQEQEEYHQWLIDNCDCLEHNTTACASGYNYEDGFCVGNENYTFALKKCSKYNCTGETHIFNNLTEEWEKEE